MGRTHWARLLSACLALVFVRPASAELDPVKVRQAIDRAVGYLKREQKADGTWPDHPGLPSGITALCTLALLNAGEPTDESHVQRALEYLRRQELKHVYNVSLQTMVLAVADPERDGLVIQRNVRWLEQVQLVQGDKKGAWAYSGNKGQGTGDNSNTQFALLALHEAERAGVALKDQTIRLSLKYWQETQNLDGSWGYMPGYDGTGSMTCAGIAALVIAADKLDAGSATAQGDAVSCCGEQAENDALERALAWMGRNFSVTANPGQGSNWLLYYLYGVERVGRLTNRRFIGQSDWYREGADMLIRQQDDISGCWKHGVGHGEDNPHVATSLALLFLAKGRRPVVVAKLKNGATDDWNHHRSDLSNLVGYVEKRWKRDLTWQTIDINQASVDDLLQSPVLFITGKDAPKISDRQAQWLRSYIDRGGFIFAEHCCQGGAFDDGFRQLMQRVFPEPEIELTPLDLNHAAYSAEEPVDAKFLKDHLLWGVNVGCRTSVIYCPENLGCYWELARLGREEKLSPDVRRQVQAARSLGTNVLAYATNREVKFKDELPVARVGGIAKDTVERARVAVAMLRHSGGWDVAPQALVNLMKAVQSTPEIGLRVVTDQRTVGLAQPEMFDYHMLFMHGRNAFSFTSEEREQLRTYVERGGLLFADSVCSSAAFTESFRREMAAVFPGKALALVPVDDAIFSAKFGGFELKRLRRRDPLARGEQGPLKAALRDVEPELEAITFGDRYGVVFSRWDLSCALERHDSLECPGYTRDDAARLGLNVVLYSLYE